MNFKKLIRNKKVAFTLAEVVVVMAILSVMMVAFAPVVTKKTIATGSNNNKVLFDKAEGATGIYYGSIGDTKSIIVGENKSSSAYHPKLLVVATSDSGMTPHIGFASNYDTTGVTATTYSGQLMMQQGSGSEAEYKGNLVLGGRANSTYKQNGADFEGNTIIGTDAGTTADSGFKHITAIGAGACRNNTGENTICIGSQAGDGGSILNNESDRIYIGDSSIDYDFNKIQFGKQSLHEIISAYTEVTPSDKRLKNIGNKYTAGLDEINQLTFYNYTYKRDSEKTPRVGVMAQDLQKVFPNAVSENKEGYLYIRKDDMFYAALNAIKQLFTKSNDNSDRIKELEDRNAVLEKQVKELQQMYVELAKQTNAKSAKKTLTQTPEKKEVAEKEVSKKP